MATTTKPAPRKSGRPSKYAEDVPRMAATLYEKGCTDHEVAKHFGVNRSTLFDWIARHPELKAVREEAKDIADDNVERSLYRQALKGDVQACNSWLRNRRANVWNRFIAPPDPTDEAPPPLPQKVVIEIQNGPAAQPHGAAG